MPINMFIFLNSPYEMLTSQVAASLNAPHSDKINMKLDFKNGRKTLLAAEFRSSHFK